MSKLEIVWTFLFYKYMIEYLIKNIEIEISNINFYNISYLTYAGLYKNKYITICHPYEVKIFNIKKDFLHSESLFKKHHSNFLEKEIIFDPCKLYETISGFEYEFQELDFPFTISNDIYLVQHNLFIFDLESILRYNKLKNFAISYLANSILTTG